MHDIQGSESQRKSALRSMLEIQEFSMIASDWLAAVLLTSYCEKPGSNIHLNSLRPSQNGRHVADDIFKRIFLNENVRILIWISLKFVPKGSINNIPTLAQIMAWRRPGDKPLSEPMMVRLSTNICIRKLTAIGSDNGLSLGRRWAIIWTNAGILLFETWEQTSVKSQAKFIHFEKIYLKMSAKLRQFCLGLNVLTNMEFTMGISQWSRTKGYVSV